MYRHLSPKQVKTRSAKIAALTRGRDRANAAKAPRGRMPDLPELRREVIVIDFDTGFPVTHTLHFYKTRRVDTFRITADGKPWKTCGWTVALEGLRKAYQRLPSPRSDFWW